MTLIDSEHFTETPATSARARTLRAANVPGNTRPRLTNAVSVVIRARNAARDLRRCLPLLRGQILPAGMHLEIVVVDNDSTDRTVEVAQSNGAAVTRVSVSEFSWGRALNVGIAATTGEIVLLLSADASPVDRRWVEQMIRPLADKRVGVVYGRQLPRPDAPIDEIARLDEAFPDARRQVDGAAHPDGNFAWPAGLAASNACAAIRRELWETVGYEESAAASEERAWTLAVLSAGRSCVYAPSARVYHSHRDSVSRFGLRAVEFVLARRSSAQEPARLRDVVQFAGCIVKNRLFNTLHVDCSARTRIEGMIRLPFEVMATLLLGAAALRCRPVWNWSRAHAWG